MVREEKLYEEHRVEGIPKGDAGWQGLQNPG